MNPRRPRVRTLLVDSFSLAYRAFFAVPADIRAPDGSPVNAVHGFLNMLSKLVADVRPAFLACAWDDDWRPQWRVDLIDSYKTHRVATEPGAEDPVDPQLKVLAELLDAAGIAVVGSSGYEAEDVIGALLPHARRPIAIVSGDRDLFQLVRDPDVWVLYPQRGVSELVIVDEAEIERRYEIPARTYADFAIIRGDPSDGLPGVRGIGAVGAAALVRRYEDLEGIIAAALEPGGRSGALAKVAASVTYLERAARVVRISDEAPVGHPDLRLPRAPPAPGLADLVGRWGVEGPVKRLLAVIGDNAI